MDREKIDSDILRIFKEKFKNPENNITLDSTPEDIQEWDSLGHVMVIGEIETHFGIDFDLDEMLNFDSIEKIAEEIFRKLNGKK